MKKEKEQIHDFFEDVTSDFGLSQNDPALLLVTHLLPDRHYFLHALQKIADPIYIIPKPKSIHQPTFDAISKTHNVLQVTKEQLRDSQQAEKLLYLVGKQVVILDMGGYFAQAINYLANSEFLLGSVEDTENGHQKYLAQTPLATPVLSVARSPLKDTEDYLVGQSVVFSTEAVLREQNVVMNNRNIGILGYGKIGRSIAQTISSRNLRTMVYDINSIKRVQAMSNGYPSPEKSIMLKSSDILFCATGNNSLSGDDYLLLKDGCYISSVTSSDDELDLSGAQKHYSVSQIGEHVELYQNEHNYFYLLHSGNAINFLHNASVGAFIYLVQAELIAGFQHLAQGKAVKSGQIESLPIETKKQLAKKWLNHFSEEV